MWWWNEEVKEAISGKVCKMMCGISAVENKNRHKRMKVKAEEAV